MYRLKTSLSMGLLLILAISVSIAFGDSLKKSPFEGEKIKQKRTMSLAKQRFQPKSKIILLSPDRSKITLPKVKEDFLSHPFVRWQTKGGNWQIVQDLYISDVEARDIYQSPEEPGHVAWTGMWKEPDGVIKVTFSQLSGNLGIMPSYRPWYGRGKTEEQWKHWCKNVVKMRIGPSAKEASKVDASAPTLATKDGGDTWEKLGPLHEPRGPNTRVVYAKKWETGHESQRERRGCDYLS